MHWILAAINLCWALRSLAQLVSTVSINVAQCAPSISSKPWPLGVNESFSRPASSIASSNGTAATTDASQACLTTLSPTTTTIVNTSVDAQTSTTTLNCRETITITESPEFGLGYSVFHNPFNRQDMPGQFQDDFFDNIVSNPRHKSSGSDVSSAFNPSSKTHKL